MPTMKPEPADTALEAQVLWLRYRTLIVAVSALVIAAVVIFAAYRFYRERRESTAAAVLASANNAAEYHAVISRYPGTSAAASSLLLLADEERKTGKFAEANSTLQSFLEQFPQHELVSTARMAIAANLESLGKKDEAFAMYQQIASANAASFNAPLALLAQAEILRSKNRDDEARRACETILSRYQNSYAALDAARLLRSLKPTRQTSTTPSPGKAVPAPSGQP